jgi:hypothetical protein
MKSCKTTCISGEYEDLLICNFFFKKKYILYSMVPLLFNYMFSFLGAYSYGSIKFDHKEHY